MTWGERFSVSFLLIGMALVFGLAMASPIRYFEVTRFNVLDARCDDAAALMKYERAIKRDFDASWRVDLYRDGVWVAAAESRRTHAYRTLAVLPEQPDLDWLTNGAPEFLNLPPGTYTVAVKWTIFPESIIPRSVEVQDSFEVFCK
jgi:hypothetical protein